MSWELYDAHPVNDNGNRFLVLMAFSVILILAVIGFTA